ncbi:TetR/AcrR family transcriptional regulator [Salibacterium aidingense]|uniref:TetR/AcrR family transcriptional regulator n=1 Tax=Salibacterium aidingense TaxID=384933 RepID=UPI00040CF31D|nr:TetR/AcrR family transcriptional regulator [Salibacterium aidingense]
MTELFENLEPKKKERILNAALEEFAENGYKRASTNKIVRQAGIGKGMLFYYFQNKQELYHYLLQYAMDIIMEEYFQRIDLSETDFVERLKQAAQVKMQCFSRHPHIFNFMGTFLLASEEQLPENLQTRFETLQREGNARIYDNIDRTLFRDDIDVEKAYHLIQWAIEGYQNHLKNKLKGEKMTSIDMSYYWDEFYEYLDVLKKTFYE